MRHEELFRLDGKLAVISGGSGAIGRGAADIFVQAGASVLLLGRNPEHLEEARAALPADAPVETFSGDVREPQYIDAVVERTASMGGVDILVNSVGVQRRKPLLEATPEDLDFIWSVNMASVFSMTQALLPQMVEKGYGKIINLCSVGSFIGLDLKTMYAISKGALAQYTRSAAVELAKYGIRVNGLAPGYVETPMTYSWIHSEREAEFLARIPMGRYATVEDLHGAFVFLASSASDYITGQIIVIDGGWTIW